MHRACGAVGRLEVGRALRRRGDRRRCSGFGARDFLLRRVERAAIGRGLRAALGLTRVLRGGFATSAAGAGAGAAGVGTGTNGSRGSEMPRSTKSRTARADAMSVGLSVLMWIESSIGLAQTFRSHPARDAL
jgi:hypothetical protein